MPDYLPYPLCTCPCKCAGDDIVAGPPVGGADPLTAGVVRNATGGICGSLLSPLLEQVGRGAYGFHYGFRPEYSNLPVTDGPPGFGWSCHDLPSLSFEDDDVIFEGSSTERIRFTPDGDDYKAEYFSQEVLTFETGGSPSLDRFVILQPDGRRLYFTEEGVLVQILDPYGHETNFIYLSGKLQSVRVADGASPVVEYLYDWTGDHLDAVTLTVGEVNVRQLSFSGSPASNMVIFVLSQWNSGWEEIERSSYRYFTDTNRIQLVLNDTACKQFNELHGSYPSGSSSVGDLQELANYEFTYDGDGRVATLKTHAGTYTYTFSYDNTSGHFPYTSDVWTSKTEVDQPDGSLHKYYYNRSANLLLLEVSAGSPVEKWYPIAQRFDEDARVVLQAVFLGGGPRECQ